MCAKARHRVCHSVKAFQLEWAIQILLHKIALLPCAPQDCKTLHLPKNRVLQGILQILQTLQMQKEAWLNSRIILCCTMLACSYCILVMTMRMMMVMTNDDHGHDDSCGYDDEDDDVW